MREHKIFIATQPRPKGRPRYARGRMYTPATTAEFEREVREAWERSEGPTFEGPVEVEVEFDSDCLTITVRELDPDVKSRLRGDLDNYVKSTLDGLNRVAFGDDRQVIRMSARKG